MFFTGLVNSCWFDSVLGVCSGSPGDPSKCRSVDPLHQSAAGNAGHEPAWVAHTDSQVEKHIYTHTQQRLSVLNMNCCLCLLFPCVTDLQSQPSVCLRKQWQQQVWTSTQTGSGICTLSGRRSRGTWRMLQLFWTEPSKFPLRCITPTTKST